MVRGTHPTDTLMAQTINHILQQAMISLIMSPSPRLDAEVLIMHVTGLTRAQLITRADAPLSTEHEATLRSLLAHRARGEPIAYLTGKREFWSLELHITPDVLIPRPETELLVEQALVRIPLNEAWTIADLGTGSGAIALAIAKERPCCHVIATDASKRALDVARANAQRLGISNAEFRHGEWFAPLAGATLDLIVSNPPYVAEDDPHLQEGDVRFEPRAALAAGAQGLRDLAWIAAQAPQYLKPGGCLLLEHGADQGEAVAWLLSNQGLEKIQCYQDLGTRPRVTAAERSTMA
jgi:release factor glutamine methyltransferase